MIITIYILFANILAFVIMGMDKAKAKSRQRRVPEKTLFLLALVGGSVGIYAGMKKFRHKTRHKSFTLGIPLMIVIQFTVLVFILLKVSA
ncbi:DUF1294 domain-containing protein [Halalkalibacter alkaliphilus]|uniref:DUF1294 domain-containing protein n=1 Tax=Halalkalibacter alkaliphilus TaxID=2917993 RepID=A0A9X2CX22_9BACI|nr:DUF1294 domain-containing protein [Halalkalibacter alkaliphilus]MCL7749802.1 DUF1294 domain-containing protein [Halalkalibacter alkaliphilus]